MQDSQLAEELLAHLKNGSAMTAAVTLQALVSSPEGLTCRPCPAQRRDRRRRPTAALCLDKETWTCCTLQRPQMSPPNISGTKSHCRVNEQPFVSLSES